MDHLTESQRSQAMRRVRSSHTQPELVVRRLLFGLGYRYRLHAKDLPGHPDIVFRSRRKVIFVHGCFWHRHGGCKKTTSPKTRVEFWQMKFAKNVARDRRTQRQLINQDWEYLVVWQCELKDLNQLTRKLMRFLER